MSALRSPVVTNDLVIISAHRGYWRDEPENSFAAWQKALDMGIESIEIDVRVSANGTPWLLHDDALERNTTGYGFATTSRDQYLSDLYLRGRNGQSSAYHLATLEEGLHVYAKYDLALSKGPAYRGFALIIDVKPARATPLSPKMTTYYELGQCIELVKKISKELEVENTPFPLLKYVVFKVPGRDLPQSPTQIARDYDVNELNLVPVLYGEDSEVTIYDRYCDGSQPLVLTCEVFQQYNGKLPGDSWLASMRNNHQTISGFPVWDEYPEGTASPLAICCTNRNPDPRAVSPTAPLYTTGNPEYWVQLGSTWITGDQLLTLQSFLTSEGKRNVSHIK